MRLKISALIAASACFIPSALADCGPEHQQTLVNKLYELQAPGAVIDAGELHTFIQTEHAKCPDDYQGTAFSVYLAGVAVSQEKLPSKKLEHINTAFSLLRQASDTYDSQMKPFAYKDQTGADKTMWAWATARDTLSRVILPHMVVLAEAGTVEPSLTGGEAAVCPYGKTPRLADESEGNFWVKLLQTSGFFGTAGLGNTDDRADYDRKLAIYDGRVGFAQNRLAALAVACPENKAQFLFDRARVLGTWAKYSDSQIGRIDRAIEDFRVDKDRLPAIYQLQSDLEDQRDARAKQAKAAYDAFYAAKAETGSHLDFKLGDKQTYIDIQGWAKN